MEKKTEKQKNQFKQEVLPLELYCLREDEMGVIY